MKRNHAFNRREHTFVVRQFLNKKKIEYCKNAVDQGARDIKT